MNEKELSIGDWVSTVAEDGKTYIGQVDSIGILRDLDMEATFVRLRVPNTTLFIHNVIGNINPIPLTRELLEDCGFVIDHIDELGQYELLDGYAKCENLQQIGDHWETSFSGIEFKYIHQFQHYLRLTNNDLADKIEL